MAPVDIGTEFHSNTYPGRGIILGCSEDGKRAVAVYFIMGRSENSRNRIFIQTGDGIRTEAFDISKMSDPSLIIYRPVRQCDGYTIVTNGDQTDTIFEHMKSGDGFRSALKTREFEPDAPNYTPRISGIIAVDGSYKLSILKTDCGNPNCCCRFLYEYDRPLAGVAHLIHTYKGNGNPLPSFEGEPRAVAVRGSLQEFAHEVWDALDNENRVSLFAREIDLATGSHKDLIINKNSK